MLSYSETPIQRIYRDWLETAGIKLFIKREDRNHPAVSGNKWWKLKYNLAEAQRLGFTRLLTFGGAYSNHIFATAAAGKEQGFETVGVIRGEEIRPLNSVLAFAQSQGMKLHYISREAYRKKSEAVFVEKLKERFGRFYLIPEGGTNSMATRGCAEFGRKIMDVQDYGYCCVPVGTGGTMAGLIEGFGGKSEVIGFSVLKNGEFLNEEVRKQLAEYSPEKFSNWRIMTEFDFGGYAKTDKVLNEFIAQFTRETDIPLEPVYTGKMMYGIRDLVNRGYFRKGATILAIHTGGLTAGKNFEQT